MAQKSAECGGWELKIASSADFTLYQRPELSVSEANCLLIKGVCVCPSARARVNVLEYTHMYA